MKFTENLRTTVADYTAKIRAKNKEIADHQRDGITIYSYEKYKEIAFELENERNMLMSEATKAVKTIIDKYKEELPARFIVSGDSMNMGDMALLTSDYKLTQHDLEAMYDRYTPVNGLQNYTMIKLIFDYCERHGIKIARAYNGEAAKAAAADTLFSYARSCFQRPEYNMETEEYFTQILPDALVGE